MDAIAVLMPLFNSSVKHYYVIEGDLQSYYRCRPSSDADEADALPDVPSSHTPF